MILSDRLDNVFTQTRCRETSQLNVRAVRRLNGRERAEGVWNRLEEQAVRKARAAELCQEVEVGGGSKLELNNTHTHTHLTPPVSSRSHTCTLSQMFK